jgi:putative hydrolase of the HAD superfamily
MRSLVLRSICFDWGGTLMAETGPQDLPMAVWPQISVTPGAAATLAALAARWPLHIATNASVSSREQIGEALKRAGLLQHFQQIFCYADIGARKDSPAFWQAVERATGVPSNHMAMVGDSLEQDVRGPALCGLHTVWFNDGGRQAMPSLAVPSVQHLSELVPYFANWRWNAPAEKASTGGAERSP